MISMRKVSMLGAGLALSGALVWLYAQERPTFRIKVDMVVLSFTVTDSKDHYINGLKPSDFRIFEDGIPQKLNTFGEGNKPPVQILEDGDTRPLLASILLPPAAEPMPKAAPSYDPTPLSAPTFSCCSTPATICIADSSTPPTRSPISCAVLIEPIRWRSTLLAAICRVRRC